jgi:HAD superfamily hydrolase (TIGR01549 family)
VDISTLIFDWSGVISDDRKPVYESNMRMLEKYGKPRMTFEDWLPKTTASVRELLANHGVNDNSDKLFEEYRQELNQVQKEGIHPIIYPETKKVLQTLKKQGKRLFVISAHPEKNLREEAREYGIEKYFSIFHGNAKDKTQAILHVCAKIAIKPSKKTVAYIGDTIYDIGSAKKAGVCSIGITNGYHMRERLVEENPDKLIDSLTELQMLFLKNTKS